jgi:hypothetical protein
MPKSIETFIINYTLDFFHHVGFESYPCADYKPGEDDLQNFDMIRKFELDVNLDGYPGVSSVRGSNRMQTAYRIDSTADLVMPTV